MKSLCIIVIALLISSTITWSQNKPFPQGLNFPGCIKPGNVTPAQMNTTVSNYYRQWKTGYVKRSIGGEIGNGFYVNIKGTGGSGSEVTTSEAHGYGMIVFALMAGFDDSAKIYYDGMLNLFDLHRSAINDNLMSWVIDPENGDSDGATDGDMDIAYSLLLADIQWGSEGKIDYLTRANTMITQGIKGSDVRTTGSKRTTLGDWDDNPYNTRPSDWMAGHVRAFYESTKDQFWLQAADTIYSLISSISSNYSSNTGLMPDFVVGQNPKPAAANFLEAETDGEYSWNACRFPWRIALDYAHYGTPAAKQSLDMILTWVKGATNNKPGDIMAGYTLEGAVSEGVDYSDMSFTAPLIAACVCDATHQAYLNLGWNIIKNAQGDYYGDSIGLLCLLFISGNWWKPDWSTASVMGRSTQRTQKQNFISSAVARNSLLTVSYDLPVTGNVKASIIDLSGRVLKEVQRRNDGGMQTVKFDLKTIGLSSGIYILRVSAPGHLNETAINYLQ